MRKYRVAFLNTCKGNILTERERKYRLYRLEQETKPDSPEPIDAEILPYLKRINRFPFLVTTQSCCGHGEDPRTGRKAHIDFRSALSVENTINKIIRPFSDKWINSEVSLMTESERLRYVLWLDNKEWEKQLDSFIEILCNVYTTEVKHKRMRKNV